MSDKTPYEPQSVPPEQPQYNDWRDQRRHEREVRRDERRAARQQFGSPWIGNGAWIGGAVLIMIGIVFLLQNMGIFFLQNWWALFILIPAFGALGSAWSQYQYAGGRLTAGARGSLLGGLFMTLIAVVFLFGFQWSLMWPVLLIIAGLGVLLNAVLPS